jgi:hypothetical protein
MDSKIIAAIIIAVALLGSTYLYTKDNAYTRCVEAWTIWYKNNRASQKEAQDSANSICVNNGEVKNFTR